MSRIEKTRDRILLGSSDANRDFEDLRRLLSAIGSVERVKGSHHIFVREGVDEIINLQPKQSEAKAYQVRQVRNIILKYRLGAIDE